jgi:serine phosphatase RsbU (regulator of sigma subunit)
MPDNTSAEIAGATRPLSTQVRGWLTGTWTGRAVLAALAVKAVTFPLWLAGLGGTFFESLGSLASAVLLVCGVLVAVKVWPDVWRRLLWRVRRKLTLSYVFIGLVPALLIIAFFTIAGLILLSSVSTYILEQHFNALVAESRAVARGAAVAIETGGIGADVGGLLQRRRARIAALHPGASLAVVPAEPCGKPPGDPDARLAPGIVVGPWTHEFAPVKVPSWVPCPGQAGLHARVLDGQLSATARAVERLEGFGPGRAVVVDLPLDAAFIDALHTDAGLTLEALAARDEANGSQRLRLGTVSLPFDDGKATPRGLLQFVSFVDFTDWDSGTTRTLIASFTMDPMAVYRRISGPSLEQVGDFSFGQILLLLLAAVGGLFLVIQFVAVAMGFVLARSITGAVHELFVGTERVRQGDFTHPIAVTSEDQLGELATSFNAMTASIDDLLAQKAEQERMKQELRIARDIQMSLLPQGPLTIPGLALEAYCEPAREVGGDYYDVLPLDGQRFGLLIADVAGKGTYAALYMAELKGIVLSLSQWHHSPRQLLIDANRIVSRHLDSRSFITMTYAVVDVGQGTFTYARAGHCPLIHVPGGPGPRTAQVLAPSGLVLGLHIDDGQTFERLLEESTIAIGEGDALLLFTDGLSEAMNEAGDCFGEARLGDLMAKWADEPGTDVGRRILGAVRAFSAHTAQQDDMTMLMLRVQRTAAIAAPSVPAQTAAGGGVA